MYIIPINIGEDPSEQDLPGLLHVRESSIVDAGNMSLPRLIGLIQDIVGMKEASELAKQILDSMNKGGVKGDSNDLDS